VDTLPSASLRLLATDGDDAKLRLLAAALRGLPKPVIGRIHKGALLLDLRCLEDEADFINQLPQWGVALA
jgi:L-seryl-tRNA(Ser) seleniumtransferase